MYSRKAAYNMHGTCVLHCGITENGVVPLVCFGCTTHNYVALYRRICIDVTALQLAC